MADISTQINKTVYSPFTIQVEADDEGIYTGIFDFIKCVSDDSADEAVIDVTPIGGSLTEIHLSSGDSLYGPFSAIEITTLSATADVIIHERSVIMQTFITEKDKTTTGYTNATPDTYQLQGISTHLGTVNPGYVSLDVEANAGTASTGIFTLADAAIASISTAGLITFSDGTVFESSIVANISYQIKLNQ